MDYVFVNVNQLLAGYLSFFPFSIKNVVLLVGTLVPLGLLFGTWEVSRFRK